MGKLPNSLISAITPTKERGKGLGSVQKVRVIQVDSFSPQHHVWFPKHCQEPK